MGIEGNFNKSFIKRPDICENSANNIKDDSKTSKEKEASIFKTGFPSKSAIVKSTEETVVPSAKKYIPESLLKDNPEAEIVDGVRMEKDKNGNKVQTFIHGGKDMTRSVYAQDGKTLISEQKNVYNNDGVRINSNVTNFDKDGRTPVSKEQNVYCEDGETLYSNEKTNLAKDGVTPQSKEKTVFLDNGKPGEVTKTEFKADGKNIKSQETMAFDEIGMLSAEGYKKPETLMFNGKPVMYRKNGKDTNEPVNVMNHYSVKVLPGGESEVTEIKFTPSRSVDEQDNKKYGAIRYNEVPNSGGYQKPALDASVVVTTKGVNGKIKSVKVTNLSDNPKKDSQQVDIQYNEKGLKTQEKVVRGHADLDLEKQSVDFKPRDNTFDVVYYADKDKPNSVKVDKDGKEIPQVLCSYKVEKAPSQEVVVTNSNNTELKPGSSYVVNGEEVVSRTKTPQDDQEVMYLKHDYKKNESVPVYSQWVSKSIPAIDEKTGQKIIIHVFDFERKESEGKPFNDIKKPFSVEDY